MSQRAAASTLALALVAYAIGSASAQGPEDPLQPAASSLAAVMGHLAAGSAKLVEAGETSEPLRRAALLDEADRHLRAILAAQGKVGVSDAMLAKAYEGLGEVALAQERYREAIGAYHEALFALSGKRPPTALSGLGFAYLRSGVLDSAVHYLEEAAALDSANAETLTNLGRAYQGLGQGDRALALYERASRADPQMSLPIYNLGVTLARRGDHAAAIPHLDRAVRSDPNSPRALIQLAASYRAVGRLTEAREAAERSVEVAPGDADAATNLGLILLDLADHEAAGAAFLRVIELDPYRPEALVALGDLRREAGRYAEAAGYYRQALLVRPDDPTTRLNLGVLLSRMGRPEVARAELESSLALGETASAYYNLGVLAMRDRKPQEATEHFARALERTLALDPGHAGAHATLGDIAVDEGDLTAAEAHYKAALAGDPGNLQASYNLADLRLSEMDLIGAQELYERCIRHHPSDAPSHYNLAYIHEIQGHWKAAAAHYRLYLQYAPNAEDRSEVLQALGEIEARIRPWSR